jgi:hypothetical protein
MSSEEFEVQNVNVSHLRMASNVKKLSAQKKEVNAFTGDSSTAFLGFFSKVKRHFTNFFKTKPEIRSIYVTNDRKERHGRNVYFVSITTQGLTYEEEQKSDVLTLKLDFQTEKIKTNKGLLFNLKSRYAFYKKLKQIGADIRNQGAYVFER